jgi:antitoxin YefM
MIRHVPYDEFRKDPAKYMAAAGGAPLRIDRESCSVVMIAEDEFEGWEETIRLLSAPANASRLLSSLAQAEAGKLTEHGLTEERDFSGPMNDGKTISIGKRMTATFS